MTRQFFRTGGLRLVELVVMVFAVALLSERSASDPITRERVDVQPPHVQVETPVTFPSAWIESPREVVPDNHAWWTVNGRVDGVESPPSDAELMSARIE